MKPSVDLGNSFSAGGIFGPSLFLGAMLGGSFATASVLLATSVVRLYDLSVARTHDYFAGGVLVHNY